METTPKEPLVLQVGGGSVKLIKAPLRLSGVLKGTEVLVPRIGCRLCPWSYSSPLFFSLSSCEHGPQSLLFIPSSGWGQEVLLWLPPQIRFSPPLALAEPARPSWGQWGMAENGYFSVLLCLSGSCNPRTAEKNPVHELSGRVGQMTI